MNRPITNRGFTLVELMIVVVIAAILLAVAVPSFRTLVVRNNVESLQTAMGRALNTARSEAASRNTRVVMCASTDGATCATGASANFGGGWIVFEDRVGDGVRDAAAATGEELIDAFRYDGNYPLRALDSAGAKVTSFAFNQQGYLTTSVAVIFACEPERDMKYTRGLGVQRSGLVIKINDATAPKEETLGVTFNCT